MGQNNSRPSRDYETSKIENSVFKKHSILSLPESAFNKIVENPPHEIKLQNGSVYRGELMDNVPHGLGREFSIKGDIFQGLYEKGEKTGFGEFYNANDKSVYEGSFYRGKFHDRGLLFKNGYCFEGIWNKGEITADGIISKNGEIIKKASLQQFENLVK